MAQIFSLSAISVLVFFCELCNAADLQFRMFEQNRPGTFVGNIVPTAGLQREGLKYFLMNQGNEYETYFAVDELTGNLTAISTIDREILCEFLNDCELLLEVAGQSTNNDGFFTVITVLVIVEDINDHSPVFRKTTELLPISEDVLTGATFTLEGARDKDTSDEFSLQTYELIPKNSNENLPFELSFSKNLDGSSVVKLRVTRHLNREDKDRYELYIVAKDGGSPPLNGTLYVNITIQDINDNYPTFEKQSYNVTVSEDVLVSTVILTVTAYDLDLDQNAEVEYRLSPRQQSENLNHFDLNPVTGELKVIKELNYNTKSSFKLIIEATDKGDVPLTNQTFVQVNVLDTGNNPPEIYVNPLPSNDFAEVSEYANIGAVVAHIAIVDNDGGRNGEVSCNVSHSKFGLQRYDNKQYKVILVDALDREKNAFHSVTIICLDKGSPPLESTSTFLVHVLDENDNAPTFEQQRYFTVIDENNAIGDKLTTVSAFDIDIGNNSIVSYTVAPLSSEYAFVNPKTGVVMANKQFDKEGIEGTGLSLTVYAIDHGNPKLTGTTTVLVTINDKNDQGPEFIKTHFRFWMDENRPSDTYVGRIRANDTDQGINANTRYMLKNIAENVPFVVFLDGTIKTNRELDREFKSEYTFAVRAMDSRNNSMTSEAMVTVYVQDVNDNAPIIRFPIPGNNTVHLPYMTSSGSLIYAVIADDKDEPATFNSKLTYSITTPNKTNFFTIDSSSGEMYLSAPIPNSDLIDKLFIVNIHVRDHGQISKSASSNLYVLITVSNVTDLAITNNEYEKNMLIVIVVASVTFVISVGILVTIFVLRRIDSQRKEASARLKVLSDNMYYKGTEKVDNFHELPTDNCYVEKSKKEVSFSIDEDRDLEDKCEHILLEVSNLLEV